MITVMFLLEERRCPTRRRNTADHILFVDEAIHITFTEQTS